MSKILAAAIREFKSTALTKAFFFGVVLFPLIILGGIMAISATGLLTSDKSEITGEIVVLDTTDSGAVFDALAFSFRPDVVKAKREAERAMIEEALAQLPGASSMTGSPAFQAAMAVNFDRPLNITITRLDSDADVEAEKDRIRNGEVLALVAASEQTMFVPTPDDAPFSIDPPGEDALNPVDLGANMYYISHAPTLDDRVINDIEDVVERAVVTQRYIQSGINPAEVSLLGRRPSMNKVSITETGEGKSAEGFQNFVVPIAFMMLIWISVMSGGQYLLMSTIEEKSSRVMEVLLSAISPFQLMVAKIIGQGVVGLLILVIYAAIGIVTAGTFELTHLIPMDKIGWLIVYFLMAYFFFAALMAAVGSAVTEIREAQSLMGPIMMLLMFPLFLWFFIADNPNSLFSQIMSFIPPATPFVMVLRVSQTTDPVPLWEVIAATIVGFGGVIFTVWAATKIFRIGVLMYGTPPTFAGLIKWLRYA